MLSLFADHPDAKFSIHRFVKHGAEFCHKFPGEWFGPSATAKCIEYESSHSLYLTVTRAHTCTERWPDSVKTPS